MAPMKLARKAAPRALSSRRLRSLALGLCACVALCGIAPRAEARPERIRAGHSYYADDFSVEGAVRDLVGEKNYEEVYQAYRYYEAIYDERERVVTFRKYQRGELVREDRYRYAGDGAEPVEHTLAKDGGPPEPAPTPPSD